MIFSCLNKFTFSAAVFNILTINRNIVLSFYVTGRAYGINKTVLQVGQM